MADCDGPSTRLINPWMLHLQKLELELKCPLCLNLLKEPVSLPCEHIFCRACTPSPAEMGSDCPVCCSHYVGEELRKVSHLEHIVNIYKSMDAVATNSLFQCLSQANLRGGKQNVNQKRKLNSTQDTQPSPASPLSFDEFKDSDDGHSDVGGQHSGMRSQAENAVPKESVDDTITKIFGTPHSSGGEDNVKEAKRQKLGFGISGISANSGFHAQLPYEDSKDKILSHSEDGYKVNRPLSNSRGSGISECLNASSTFICAFCKSSRVSEASGPMMHYANGKLVEGEDLVQQNILHVHTKCSEWAPQAYFDGDTLMGLEPEIVRANKLKCNSCGLKGAALGCYAKTCNKTFHVPCAVNVSDCRWDCVNYLMLCPAHKSLRFPNEGSKSKKRHGKSQSSGTPVASRNCYNDWEALPGTADKWVLCGSALSSADKSLLDQFARITGANVAKTWQPDVTHVIACTDEKGACSRTLKVLMAILNGRWILKTDWIKACMKAMHPVDEEAYEVGLDNHGCHGGPKKGRLRVMDKAPKLFSGLQFYFSGDFVPSFRGYLEDLVLAAGGTLLTEDMLMITRNCGAVVGSVPMIVYSVDPPLKNESIDLPLLVSQRREEAKTLGVKIGGWVVDHQWILNSVAACKLLIFSL